MQTKTAKFTLGLCQIKTLADKQANLRKAAEMIKTAAARGAQVIMLPDMFVTPYTRSYMLKDAEAVNE